MVNKPLAVAGGDDLGEYIMDEADAQMLAAIEADRDYWEWWWKLVIGRIQRMWEYSFG